jgi:hypothetical protein
MFKVGDKVVCVRRGDNVHITIGQVYTVLKITYNNWIEIYNNRDEKCEYSPDLFLRQAPATAPAQKALEAAKNILEGGREGNHGKPEDNFQAIADYWNVYLRNLNGKPLTALDVALMMDLLKTARIKNGQPVFDSFVDKIGYSALGANLANRD